MAHWQTAMVLGLLTGGLGIAAVRFPLFAWVALAPLGLAMGTLPPTVAAIAGAIAGAATVAPSFPTKTLRPLLALGAAISAASWAAAAAGVAAIWPDGECALAVLMVPLFAVVSVLPLRVAG